VSYLVERLAELRRHLDHLIALRPRVRSPSTLQADLSLHNDVLFSLLMVAQLVIDIAGDLAARHGLRFEETFSSMNTSPWTSLASSRRSTISSQCSTSARRSPRISSAGSCVATDTGLWSAFVTRKSRQRCADF